MKKPKTVTRRAMKIRVTVTVDVTAPADSPLFTGGAPVRAALDYGLIQANEYSDGRHAFSTELIHDGAQRLVHGALERALDEHHTLQCALKPPRKWTGAKCERRNKAVSADMARLHALVSGAYELAFQVEDTDEKWRGT